jgi:hypothetical protein
MNTLETHTKGRGVKPVTIPLETFFESCRFLLSEYSDLFLTMGQNLFSLPVPLQNFRISHNLLDQFIFRDENSIDSGSSDSY